MLILLVFFESESGLVVVFGQIVEWVSFFCLEKPFSLFFYKELLFVLTPFLYIELVLDSSSSANLLKRLSAILNILDYVWLMTAYDLVVSGPYHSA